jgi:hypothetical protein
VIRGALGSRYGISPLGRGVIRPASGGWWLSGGIAAANCIAAYQPKGAADYAASLVNLANTGTYNATGFNTPGWNATDGWILVGYSPFKYMRTGITSFTTGWSIVARLKSTGSNRLFGVQNAENKTKQSAFNFSNGKLLWALDSILYGTDTSGTKDAHLAILGNKGYLNGTLDGTGTDAADYSGVDFQIGGYNKNGTADGFAAGITEYVYSFAIYNTVITTAQLAALVTAMNAL